MPITLKEIRAVQSNLSLLMEAVSNDDKGKLFEILHAKHMHPEVKLPTHYRDEEGKSPEEVHNSIKSRISEEEYSTIEDHARDSAANMREHLRDQGHNPDHITHVAWTSNGASDVKKFTDKDDPHNDSDVMYRFKHPKTGKVTHAGVGLKYGSQKEPNLRNPGLDSLERMTGAKTLLSRFEKHKKKIKTIGYTGTTAENHARWKKEKTSKRGKAAEESKLETTRGIAKDIHNALSQKSSDELKNYILGVVSPQTAHPTFRLHTRTSHNEAGSTASHHIDEPSKDIEIHLSQFSSLHMEKKHRGGISAVIYGTRKSDGKVVPVLQHAIKGVSGPMKGLAATTKLPGYRSSGKKTIKEDISKAALAAQIAEKFNYISEAKKTKEERKLEAEQRNQLVKSAALRHRQIDQERISSDAKSKSEYYERQAKAANIAAGSMRRKSVEPETQTSWRDEEGRLRGVGGARFAATMASRVNLADKSYDSAPRGSLDSGDVSILQAAAKRIEQRLEDGSVEKKVNEEAPANSMGTAGISGLDTAVDVGIAGRDMLLAPGLLRRPPPKMFGGKRVFTVPSSDYYKATLGRKKGQHWRSMVNGPLGEEIRQYALENKEAPIIVEDETTGAMMYLRYGKR